MVTDRDRRIFDAILDQEVDALPDDVYGWLDEVPLIVEDEPSAAVLEAMGMEADDEELCGLHWGTPLTDRSVEGGQASLPDRMMLFRGPIIRLARESYRGGRAELRRQIRITLLHEIGHHFGLDEDDLDALGYG